MRQTRRQADITWLLGPAKNYYGQWAQAAVLFLSLGLIPYWAVSAEAPTFQQLLQQSLSNAPALLEQAAHVRAASGDAQQARAWLNPSISAVSENIGGNQSGGINQRQDTYTVTQPIDLGGKRIARIEAGERVLAAVQARSQQAQITFSAKLAVAYATAEAMQLRKDIAGEELMRAKDDLLVAEALVKAGREAELRVVQAQSSVASAQATEQAAIADAIEAMERLSALVGAKESYTSIAHPFLIGASGYRPELMATSADAPAVITAVAEREAWSAQAGLEEKRWFPDIGLSVGLRKFSGTGDNTMLIGISASIPLFDRNSGAIAAARERVTVAEARLEITRLEAKAEKRSATAQLSAADMRVKGAILGESTAAEAYRLGRIGYNAGKTSLLELLMIRRTLNDAKLLTIDAHLARIRALALLSIADGRMAFGEK